LYDVTMPVFAAMVLHVVLFVDCSTRYPTTAEPPLLAGADHVRVA
jgi:hypothetical protein